MLILPEDITYKKMWKLACGKWSVNRKYA
jgi:hypothetical protein